MTYWKGSIVRIDPTFSTPLRTMLSPESGHCMQVLVTVFAKCLSSQLMHLPVAGLLILYSQRSGAGGQASGSSQAKCGGRLRRDVGKDVGDALQDAR